MVTSMVAFSRQFRQPTYGMCICTIHANSKRAYAFIMQRISPILVNSDYKALTALRDIVPCIKDEEYDDSAGVAASHSGSGISGCNKEQGGAVSRPSINSYNIPINMSDPFFIAGLALAILASSKVTDRPYPAPNGGLGLQPIHAVKCSDHRITDKSCRCYKAIDRYKLHRQLTAIMASRRYMALQNPWNPFGWSEDDQRMVNG